MATLEKRIPEEYHHIFNSIMPGGPRWHREVDDCLENCPYYDKPCDGSGPSKKLCSKEWGKVKVSTKSWMVLKHIFNNFDFYNSGDLDTENLDEQVGKIIDLLDFPFDEDLTETEIYAIVKIRIKQTEFKNRLFSVWDGCSLKDISVNNRYLIASHIVPWAKSRNDEKIDKYNGLLLPPNYDYLFDRHLVSFDEMGNMLTIQTEEMLTFYTTLGISKDTILKMIPDGTKRYLAKHRATFLEIRTKYITRGKRGRVN